MNWEAVDLEERVRDLETSPWGMAFKAVYEIRSFARVLLEIIRNEGENFREGDLLSLLAELEVAGDLVASASGRIRFHLLPPE